MPGTNRIDFFGLTMQVCVGYYVLIKHDKIHGLK